MKTNVKRAAPDVIQELRERRIATPNIADVMNRFRATGGALVAVTGDEVYLAGSALTVRTPPADNLMVHKAIDIAQPGEVIVVEAGGDMSHAILGELMCMYARERGVAGFVVDGPVRDGAAIRSMGFPVFAKGLTPRGPYKEGPGEVNEVISCAGATVCPGDVVVGDADGVAVIPRESAQDVVAAAAAVQSSELDVFQQIREGRWPRDWVDATLERKGCELDV